MTKKTDQTIDTPEPIELAEDELQGVTGGSSLRAAPQGTRYSKWKMASLDGKGNDVLTEEIAIVHESIGYKPG